MSTNDLKLREKGIARTSLIGILGNIVLVTTKAIIGIIAGSISIIMDAVNNLTDALSSIITIIGTKLSGKKPDKKHPFGHGRVEYITSAIIGIIILVAGITAIYESILSIIDHFKNGTMADYSTISLIIIGVAILIKASLGFFFRFQGKKYESDALKASGVDALFDVLLSLGTLVGALVSKFANFYVEGYIGIIIGLFILRSGFEVIKGAVTYIIGSKFDEDLANEIKTEICKIKGVDGAYDLILNNYGYNRYIGSVHVGVKDNLSAKEIQDIERAVNYLMYTKYNTIMTTGIYAENTTSEIAKEIKHEIIEIIKAYEVVTQLHGFYIDETRKFVNFDLVVSFDMAETDDLVKQITDKLNSKYEDYTFFINIDRDF